MLGYVTIEKGELKVKDFDLYQAYYCGICKAIGKRLGQVPRMTLSYDAVFLAMVLDGLTDGEAKVLWEHCMVHPIAKKPILLDSPAADYAADVMVILAYHKFLDDWNDERSGLGLAGKTALSGAYRKLRQKYLDLCRGIEEDLAELSRMEKSESGNLDQVSRAFAAIMERLFTGYSIDNGQMRVLANLGKALGKWIYIIDALDDFPADYEKQQYNPLRFRTNGLEGLEDLLYNILADIANTYDLLDLKRNRAVIENIIFMGIRTQTDRILRERIEEHEQSI
ncbi:MAG: DUF5685 family protein [Emergencia sp.]